MPGTTSPQFERAVAAPYRVPAWNANPPDAAAWKVLVDKRTLKPFPKNIEWRFTGSVMTKPDPNKSDEVYGADFTGTLIVIFPVTNATVLQTNLTMEYERFMKLETNTKTLPPVGTPVKLILEVPKK